MFKYLQFVITIILITTPSKCLDIQSILQDIFQTQNIPAQLENLSEKCQSQLAESRNSFAWLQMIDSSTKVIDGIFAGNFYNLGNYDECYRIEVINETSEINFYGKFCIGTISFSTIFSFLPIPDKRILGLTEDLMGVHTSLCIPSGCTAEEASNFTFNLINFQENFCYSQDKKAKLTWGVILTITILIIFVMIAIISTIFDLILYYKNKQNPHKLFVAFSLFSNGKKLISPTKNPDHLSCLNGFRAISMMWVILGHKYALALMAPISNFLQVFEWKDQISNMFVIGATVSVDSFFLIGGLVTVFVFLRSLDKGVKFNLLFFYALRYLRLTPALAIVILFYTNLWKYLGSGPVWGQVGELLVKACEKYWWYSLLYIQNFTENSNICLSQTWYLSADWQLYLVSPIILVSLSKWPKYTIYGLLALVIGAVVSDFFIGYYQQVPAFFLENNLANASNFMDLYYVQPYARFGPYVMGMILGYVIYQLKKSSTRLSLTLFMVIFIWMVSLTGMIACVYAAHDKIFGEYDSWWDSAYLAFNRHAWALGLSGVIFLCVSGYGGPIDVFLSHPVFQFLSKLSYSIYLVHYGIILMNFASVRSPVYFSNTSLLISIWGDFMVILVSSLVLCLLFESPLIIISKLIYNMSLNNSNKETLANS